MRTSTWPATTWNSWIRDGQVNIWARRNAWSRRITFFNGKLLGDVAAHQERHAEAARSYELALEVLTSHPCPLIEWKIVTALAASVQSSGQKAGAADLRERALSVKRSLAESIANDRLRRKFLAGEVRGIVA
jgi:hypothetical protein